MKKMSLFHSVPLGIGSIIGSGILFLPSMTYKVSGSDVLVSWVLIIALCIPGIFFFNDMVKLLREENTSLSGMVELGLGKDVGGAVNLILLGTVIFGMPSAAIVASNYCAEVFEYPALRPIVSFLLITVALGINSFGIKASSIVSFFVSAMIILISIYIISETTRPISSYSVLKPDFKLNNIYSGAVLSFWAFAGFENLTFLYHKFKNPRRDLIITIVVSIFTCGLLYLGLVANYSAIVPYFEIRQTTGLIQMVQYGGNSNLPFAIAFFAILAVGINLISWTSGVIQLILQTAKQGVLAPKLIKSEKSSLTLLGLLFYFSLAFGLGFPDLFSDILTAVSSNFLVLYLLLIVSYINVTNSSAGKVIAILIAISLLVTLSSSSYLLFYPFLLFLVSCVRTRAYAKI